MKHDYLWVDTSFLYGLFVQADKNHKTANRVWKEIIGNRRECITSNLIVSELGTILAYRFGHQIAAKHTALVLDSALLHKVYADQKCETAALTWWRKHPSRKFSFVDCVSFQFMTMLGIGEALAFDNDFRVAGFRVMVVADNQNA